MDIEELIKNYDVYACKKFLEKKLEENPKDIKVLIKLALTELELPDEDFLKALEYVDEIYKISPDNLDALILEAGIKKCHMYIDYELFKRLDEVKNSDNKINAIAVYLKFYYPYHSFGDCKKKLLEKSIGFYDGFVYPLEHLGYALRDEGKTNEAKKMFKKALSNVKKVYYDYRDFTNLDEFIGEFITGIYLSDINYNHIKKLAED